MTARIVDGKRFKSRSDYARFLLGKKRGKLTDSEIAKAAKMTPQTVYAIKKKMFGL